MAAKIFIVNHAYEAKYKVCFVDNDYQQNNQQLIMGGKLVKEAYQADVKLFIVEHAYQADILITRKNFEK